MAIGPIGHGKTFAILCSILKNCNENDQTTQAILFCTTYDSAWESYTNALQLLDLAKLSINIGFVSKDSIPRCNTFQVLIGTVADVIDVVEENNLFCSLREVYFDDGDWYITTNYMRNFIQKMYRRTRVIYVSSIFNKNAIDVIKACGRSLDFIKSAQTMNHNIQHYFIKYDSIETKYHILKNICQQVEQCYVGAPSIGQLIIFCSVSFSICCYKIVNAELTAYMHIIKSMHFMNLKHAHMGFNFYFYFHIFSDRIVRKRTKFQMHYRNLMRGYIMEIAHLVIDDK